MGKIKTYFRSRGADCYLALASVLCGIAGVILYRKFGINAFNIELDQKLILMLAAASAVGAVSLVLDYKAVRYLAYLLFLYDFVIYIGTQAKYIANVVVGIDGNSFTPGFLANLVCLLLAFVLMLIAAIRTNKGKNTVTEVRS